MWNEGISVAVFTAGLIISIWVLVRLLTWKRREKEGFPPGPWEWPGVGHLYLFFFNLPHQALAALSKGYGPIIGLRLGQQAAIVVSSPESARDILLTHDKLFADRPPLDQTSIALFGTENGLLFSRLGPRWRHHRKICTLHLFTAKRLHELWHVRQQELHTLLLSIHHQSGAGTRAVDLGTCVGQMSSSLLMRLLQSKAIVQTGGENLQQIIKEAEQEVMPTFGDLKIPFLSVLDFFRKQRMRRLHARLDKIYTEMLMERKETTALHDDLLHALLSEQEALTVAEIKSILHDMIGAGIHTTPLIIEWAMAELLRNPRCLQRLQREIDSQVGEKKEVSETDLPNLSYLKCVVKEVTRLHPVAPLLIPRISTQECELQGYRIPAKTWVFVNVWAIGRDERVWPSANDFMPERFEGKDVDLKGQHFELLPFGSGRRKCLGMPLALPVIEVTLANLVSCFDWELPYGETCESINMDEKRGLTANKATPVVAIPKPRVSFSKLPNAEDDKPWTVVLG